MGRIVKMPLISIALILLSVSLACLSGAGSKTSRIPPEGLDGLDVDSVKILGRLKIADWAENVSSSAYFTLFEGRSLSTNRIETRVFYENDSEIIYIGSLSNYFDIPELDVIFIDLGYERCIIGRVSQAVNGKPLYVHFERVESDRSKWMLAQKESSIEDGIFIIPITGDDIRLWNYVTMVAIQTQESLDRGFAQEGSYFEIEKRFEPYIDIYGNYILILVQNP